MPMQTGYAVTSKGFVNVDPKDLTAHSEALDVILKAKSGAPEALLAVMDIETIDVRSKSRRAAAEAEAPATQEAAE